MSLKENFPAIILLALALATRFVFLGYPSEVVFDEVHFGKFISAYFSHQYYFDIHPPLGKLMIAGFARLNFATANFGGFAQIGEVMDAQTLFVLRFLPALFGSLLVLLIYQVALALGLSQKAAFLAGFLVALDNAFLVESKFILVDSFLFFFGFLAIWLFLQTRKQTEPKKEVIFYSLAALSAGLALSIKWTGLAFWGIIFVFALFDFLARIFRGQQYHRSDVMLTGFKLLSLAIIPFLVYSLQFIVHFELLNLPGPGDAFMSQNFQSLSFGEKFKELNRKMFSYNAGLKQEHQDASRYYEWLLGRKPVWYWSKTIDDKIANIYLIGNPLIWWSSLLAVFWGFWALLKDKKDRGTVFFLLLGYLINLLPFIFVNRVAFLYHYLPSLIFAILLLAFLSDKLSGTRSPIAFVYSLMTALVFLLLAPISYGFLLNSKTAFIYQLLIKAFH